METMPTQDGQDLVDMLITCRDRYTDPIFGIDWFDAAEDIERLFARIGIDFPENKHKRPENKQGVKE